MKTTKSTNIGFVNPESGEADETQFDTHNDASLYELWWNFCLENGFITYVDKIIADYVSGEPVKEEALPENMVKVWIHLSPYANQDSEAVIPKEVLEDVEALSVWVNEHFNEIMDMAGAPKFDYRNTVIDIGTNDGGFQVSI